MCVVRISKRNRYDAQGGVFDGEMQRLYHRIERLKMSLPCVSREQQFCILLFEHSENAAATDSIVRQSCRFPESGFCSFCRSMRLVLRHSQELGLGGRGWTERSEGSPGVSG